MSREEQEYRLTFPQYLAIEEAVKVAENKDAARRRADLDEIARRLAASREAARGGGGQAA